jgi:hypothetical protein
VWKVTFGCTFWGGPRYGGPWTRHFVKERRERFSAANGVPSLETGTLLDAALSKDSRRVAVGSL